MADVLWFNGRFTSTDERVLTVEDRGFLFGDAVYEVFKFLGKGPVFLRDHWLRLEKNLTTLEIAHPWNEESFRAMVRGILERTQFADGIIYIEVSRGEGERAQVFPDGMTPNAIAYSRRMNFPDAAKKERGIKLITTRDRRWKHCDVKSVNLLANTLAKKEAQRKGADEALLVDDGIVREGGSANFFAVHGDVINTHPLDEYILPGVTRHNTIAVARAAGLRVDEKTFTVDVFETMDEAFISSTSMGVMPVAEIDGRRIGNGRGPVTARVQALFDAAEERSTHDPL